MSHDIERHDGDEVVCTCGNRYPSVTSHYMHFQVERARAALRGDPEG